MLANWVKETISAGGAGNLTLSGAASGFVTFNTAFGTSRPFWYAIEDGTSREVGEGYLSASTTLVRAKVHETLVSGTLDRTAPSAINATTSAIVSCAASQQAQLGGHPGWSYDSPGADGMCSLGSVSEASGSQSIATNYLHMFPFWWGASKEVSQATVQVSTAASAGGVMRLGIYSIASNGKPGYLIKEFTSAAVIDTTTTGPKVATPSATIWIPSGFYYVCILTGTAQPNVRGPQYSPGGMWLGSTSGTGASIYCLIRSFAYAVLPADESAQTYSETAYSASIWLK